MKPLELNLQKIKLEGEKKENENYRFRIYLKGVNGQKLDRNVHSLYEDISGRIDCTKCGNCCSTLKPSVSKKEIALLAKIENESVKSFTDKFTEKIEFESERYLKDNPCRYLSDCKCTIYESRPKECRSYPHLHKPGFVFRLLNVINNYSICPIVYNVYEELKMIYRFR